MGTNSDIFRLLLFTWRGQTVKKHLPQFPNMSSSDVDVVKNGSISPQQKGYIDKTNMIETHNKATFVDLFIVFVVSGL